MGVSKNQRGPVFGAPATRITVYGAPCQGNGVKLPYRYSIVQHMMQKID